MPRTAEQIEIEALQLSATERIRIAGHLLESLEPGLTEDPAAIEVAWLEEANRRYEQYLQGKQEAMPAEQVFNELLREGS